ncbi:MAG: ImcF-related family protein [Bryobacteraceae bacterium]
MSHSTKRILLLVGVFLIWVLGTGLLVGLLPLDAARGWILRGALALIGIAGIAAWLWMRPAGHTPTETDALPQLSFHEEIDALIRDAERKLASHGRRARIGELPLFFVIGESGSAKTSVMLNSGIETELLAGQVFQGDSVSPTRALNLWISERALFAEIAGAFISSAEACAYIVRRLQPRRAAAVLAGKAQAPRAALVCVDCETFIGDGAAQSVPALGRMLLSRLTDVSQALGIHLPVYVLFTKSDKIPYFRGFMRNLTKEETRQPFGAALVPFNENAGVYAEVQGARVEAGFDAIFHRAASARAEHLERAQNAAWLPGVYEFPREFRKLKPLVSQFLVDVCRPRQIGTGPFLRGFYFSGIRHVVEEGGAGTGGNYGPAPAADDVNATRVFRSDQSNPASNASPRAVSFKARLVPQWLFLTHLFNRTLRGDRAAQQTSAVSEKSNRWRHVLLASAGVLASVFALGFTFSWRVNAKLERTAIGAAQGLSAAPDSAPSLLTLQLLNDLQAKIVALDRYRIAGPPAGLRWGLYHGAQALPLIRSTYFSHFQRLLLTPTRNAILARMKALPPAPAPTESCQEIFDGLKGYLMTTDNPDKATRSFLAPLLAKYWRSHRDLDDDRRRLADSQFSFYADQFRIENPLPGKADAPTVRYARAYLNKCDAEDRQYSALMAGISTTPVSFHGPPVTNTYKVPGRYTADAWAQVQARLGKPPSTEDFWVVGPAAAGLEGTNSTSLSARYRKEYIAEWRAYLRAGSVGRYKDLRDADAKLKILSGPKSPLLGMLQLASRHTSVDKDLAAEFRASQSVVPPMSPELISDPNKPYMTALGALQLAVSSGSEEPVLGDPARAAIKDAQDKARQQVNPLKLAFGKDPTADALEKFLNEPISHVEDAIPNPDRDREKTITNGLNKLRQTLLPLLGKYPFNRESLNDVTLEEFDTAFAPGTGAIWEFQSKILAEVVLRNQGQWNSPVPEKKPQASPELLTFLNQAQRITDAFYPSGAPPAHFNYALRPNLDAASQDWLFVWEADGKKQTWSKDYRRQAPFAWPAAKDIERGGKLGWGQGAPNVLYSWGGLWGIFRVMDYAEPRTLGNKVIRWKYTALGSRHEPIVPAPIDVELVDLPAGIDVFNRDLLGAFHLPQKALR